ncbi:MAG: methyltransferase domain-containing protein [Chloroflexaceae bacterium]|nr:methyltransferase domain-containing protein [Chloroflexaceae bacterium]NJO04896.1 methyltransferase domain-containing protein [Chloroflexaceae bacterium]
MVLDAGSGAGYGAAYLAEHGARFVWGVDNSSAAVAFSRRHFVRPNLQFLVMNLEELAGFPAQSFDAIFSSNTLEHVPDIERFFHGAWYLLKSDGVLVIAVPPITNDRLRGLNIDNPYHLNIWTPRQWHATLRRYFSDIQVYGHGYGRLGNTPDWSQSPATSGLTERSFHFEPMLMDDLVYVPESLDEPTLTTIFVARQPLPVDEIPPPGSAAVLVDHSFTRSLTEAAIQLDVKRQIKQLQAHLQHYSQHVAVLDTRLHQAQAQHDLVQRTLAEAQQHAAHLEAELARKNQHILHLESQLRQIERGRLMRLLRLLRVPGR